MSVTTTELPSTTPDTQAATAVRPSVAIVIANYNGERDLPGCLDSIKALDYPADKVHVVVVENGSSDGSRDLLSRQYPWVQVLHQETNLGFAPAVNLGVEAADSELVALLNNDMQVEPTWLDALVDAYDPAAGYTCVAGTILDWDGTHIDFAEGVLNWHGMGDQIGFGLPVDNVSIEDGRELLFACGGAMLISRAVYLQLGGLDADYFAYFEDVDFGWRLWLSGHKVRLAADARCRHRHNGTSGRFPFYQRALLYERNALRTIVKNLDDENLGRILGPALLLMIQRALDDSGTSRSTYDFGAAGDEGATDEVPRSTMARLHGIGDVIGDLDALMQRRREIQLARTVPDSEVLSRFGRPFRPLGGSGRDYVERAESVRRNFRIEESFERSQATRVAVLAYDRIGDRMAGPAVRSWEIAQALATSCRVSLLTSTDVTRTAPGVDVLKFDNGEQLRQMLVESDVVLVHGYALVQYPVLRTTKALLVVDLYDPWIFENLEMRRETIDDRVEDFHVRQDVDVQAELLDRGDFFICASERQRDYWLGMLTARGRVDRVAYAADSTLRNLIDVLPYGCPSTPLAPEGSKPVLKGVHPAVPADSIVVTWGGGTWEWFDPVLVLEAFADAYRVDSRLRLFFMGLDQAAGDGVPKMRVAQRLRARADELGLTDVAVVFGSWAPYDERGRYLAETDMGVMATKDLAEARLAFRSRMLDHFWGGIPTITTDGDVLAELIDAKNAGIVVPVGDRAALTNAMLRLAGDPKFRTECAKNAAELADTYRWTETVAPLRRIARNPSQWRTTRSMRLSRRQYDLTEDSQALLLQRRGQIDDYASLARLFHFVGNSKVLLPIARFVKRRILRR